MNPINRGKAGLLCTVLAALASTLTVAQLAVADVQIVKNAQPVGVVYVPKGSMTPPPPQRTNARNAALAVEVPIKVAVEELNYHLNKMSGATLKVVEVDPAAPIKPEPGAIYLGLNTGLPPQKTSESKEGFRLVVDDKSISITGQSDRAVMFGVYELLNRLGIEWVMPGEIGEIIPKSADVVVKTVDVSQAPDFLVRSLWYRGYGNKTYARKPEEFERFATWIRRERGGRIDHPAFQTAGHFWDQFIKIYDKEFKADPTMLALTRDRQGQLVRKGPQLESTHPRVIQLMVDHIKGIYKKNIDAGLWTKDTAAGFPIGPADGLGYSQSEETKKASSGRIDPIVGDADTTDLLVLLGNQILEEVHKEYPNAYVGFYSYSTHADYPVRYTPNKNMVVIFAPINFSRFHSALDPNSYTQAYYKQVVEKWGELSRKQGNPLIYRGYNWNLAENLMPYTKVRIWGDELPYYKKHNFLGTNVEATKQWGTLGPSDWVYMKMAWDTTLDWKQLLKRYCELAYGDAAPIMEEFNLFQINRQSEAKQEAGSYHAYPQIYSMEQTQKMLDMLDKAAAMARTPEQKTRILYARQPVESLMLYLKYFHATNRFEFVQAKEYYDALVKYWQDGYAMNTDVVSNEGYAYLMRFLDQFVKGSVKYSTGEYKIAVKIPDELPTKMDKDEVGHLLKYQEPGLDDSKWTKTRTISTTWDAQGLARDNRSGAVWYRVKFTGPAFDADKKQGVGLFMGGFEDEARIWLNGQFIGTSGRRFSNPSEFDLTAQVKPGQPNTLAIMIVRNSAANEIGLGGILRPSFIFTGPRLEKVAPVQEVEMRRVLPGGELGEIEK